MVLSPRRQVFWKTLRLVKEMKVSLIGGCESSTYSVCLQTLAENRELRNTGIIGSLWVPSYIASPPRWLTRLRRSQLLLFDHKVSMKIRTVPPDGACRSGTLIAP